MPERFDPYHVWLGIPPEEQPPDHYRLLGIKRFESDPEVIQSAVMRQSAHVRTFQLGRHAQWTQRLLNEISTAKVCLLDRRKKEAYDAGLQATGPRARVIRIGAAPDNDVVLDFPMISGHHAVIRIEGTVATIEDLGSTNGTAIGTRANKIRRARLSPDDVVYFGSHTVSASRLLAGK